MITPWNQGTLGWREGLANLKPLGDCSIQSELRGLDLGASLELRTESPELKLN